MVAIDLSKAFDTVCHETLLNDIHELDLCPSIKKFLACYLRGRRTYVEFRGAKSRPRQMNQGVPQGGILSPTLFNLYMSKIPAPPSGTRLVTYADDSTVLKSGPSIDPICLEINTYLDTLNDWFTSRNLLISAPKSSATLFTTWGNEKSKTLPIKIKGNPVPTVENPTILGVTLDPLFNFGAHAKKIKEKIGTRNNVLKTLAGSSWGKEKETLLTTHKALSGSILNYCAPIWAPNLSDTNWQEIQAKQNEALRITTGCLKMSDIDHLHSESKILPAKDHAELLSKQFLLATCLPSHPNHNPTNFNTVLPQKEKMKETLSTKHSDALQHYTREGITDNVIYKEGIKNLHTAAVARAIANQRDNKVLNQPAPRIDKSEATLPRKTRSILAQLRSGYSTHLNSYLHRINPTKYPTDKCPDCNLEQHTTCHLFTCPANTTNLTPRDLWDNPTEVAAFLGLPNHQEVNLDDND